jgi:hypothetical protein
VAALAASRGVPLIVDSTMATPALCRPIEHGATLVVHSATKFIGGHGTAIGGVLLDSGKFDFSTYPSIAAPSPAYHDLRFFDTFGHYGFLTKARAETLRDTGACISPFNSFLLIQGLETLSLRMERQSASALRIAQFLEGTRPWPGSPMRGCPAIPTTRWPRGTCPRAPGRSSPSGSRRPAEGRARGGQEVHRGAAALLPPGQHRGREEPCHSSGLDNPPAALRRGAGKGRGGPRADPAFVGLENVEDLDMGPGPGSACAITLNSALTPEQQRLYQDPLVIQRLLREARTIAIVGLSTDPQRASWFVASYLKKEGYRSSR